MTYKYNPFWQQRIRETVRHALNVHPRLTALRVDLRFPDVPAATDAAVISRFINALKARIVGRHCWQLRWYFKSCKFLKIKILKSYRQRRRKNFSKSKKKVSFISMLAGKKGV